MKRFPIFLFLLLFVLAPAPAARAANDPKADEVGRSMIQAMGGNAAWERARYFRFDFTVVRDGKKIASFAHAWDRWTGRYRVEGEDAHGVPWKAYFDVNSRQGTYWVNGAKAEGQTSAQGLENAYGRFINDSYWLLAPWKIFDPGVHLAYVGPVRDAAGNACDEIKLSFDGVGLTPKDVYWMDVDTASHLLTQWKFVLNGGNDPPTVVAWKEWKKVGPIMLSVTKPFAAKPAEIRFENLRVEESPDEAALAPPK
jgi:hypothetical protein